MQMHGPRALWLRKAGAPDHRDGRTRRYAHFSYNYQDTLGSYPTWNCTIAHASFAFDNYTGSSTEYLQWQSSTFFASRTGFNKHGWYPYACSSVLDYICEVPWKNIACPPSPPPALPLAMPAELCLPAETDKTHCEPTGASCYFYMSRSTTYDKASVACKALRGAHLISYNTAAEQLYVESWFKSTGVLSSYYWLGLERSGNLYYW